MVNKGPSNTQINAVNEIFKPKKKKKLKILTILWLMEKRIIMNTLHPPPFKRNPWKSNASYDSAPTSEASQMAGGVDQPRDF